jgi:hypothetical protein
MCLNIVVVHIKFYNLNKENKNRKNKNFKITF